MFSAVQCWKQVGWWWLNIDIDTKNCPPLSILKNKIKISPE
jgi:hypothetical protein